MEGTNKNITISSILVLLVSLMLFLLCWNPLTAHSIGDAVFIVFMIAISMFFACVLGVNIACKIVEGHIQELIRELETED